MPKTLSFSLSMAWAIGAAMLLTQGALWLFYGWKLYRFFASVVTALVAAVVGTYFVSPHFAEKYALIPPFVMAIVGGILAIPLHRAAAFLLTGALGAVAGVAVGVVFCHVPLAITSRPAIACAAAGFLIAGIPAAIFLRVIVVFLTSAYGAIAAMAAAVIVSFLCLCVRRTPPADSTTLAVLVGTWLVLTFTGMVFQYKFIKAERAEKAEKLEAEPA
jgi:hypothetical protein